MKRSWLLALLLCTAVILGSILPGCAASNMGLVVGQVGKETVTFRDVTLYANYMMLTQGYSRSDLTADDIKGVNGNALDYVIANKVILQKAAALGLYPLSAENQKKVEDNFNAYMASLSASYLSAYAGSADAEAQAKSAVDASLAAAGLTEEDIRTLLTDFEARDELMAETTKDVTVSDDEIQTEYNNLLAAQQTSYTADPTAYDTALTDGSTVVVYRPEGYRYIKHILVAMPSDIASQITSATGSGDTAAVATLREQGLAQIEDRANEALAKVKSGGDFDALMAQYGEDPGMQAEPGKTTGYQVGAKSQYVPEFLAAAMGLAKIGDTTNLVATDYGYHILKYVGNVPSGAVALADVKDGIRTSVLATKQSDAFTALLEQWKKETTIKKNAGKVPVITASPSPAAG